LIPVIFAQTQLLSNNLPFGIQYFLVEDQI